MSSFLRRDGSSFKLPSFSSSTNFLLDSVVCRSRLFLLRDPPDWRTCKFISIALPFLMKTRILDIGLQFTACCIVLFVYSSLSRAQHLLPTLPIYPNEYIALFKCRHDRISFFYFPLSRSTISHFIIKGCAFKPADVAKRHGGSHSGGGRIS